MCIDSHDNLKIACKKENRKKCNQKSINYSCESALTISPFLFSFLGGMTHRDFFIKHPACLFFHLNISPTKWKTAKRWKGAIIKIRR